MSKTTKGEYYFVISDDIAKSSLTPAEKLVACSITKRTRDRSKTDFMLLKATWIMDDWGISQEIVTTALKKLISLGVIEKKRCAGGNLVRWVGWGTPGMEEEDWDAIPLNTVCETVKHGISSDDQYRVGRYPLQTGLDGIPCKPGLTVSKTINVLSNGTSNEREEEGTYDSVTESQRETTRTKLPSAPSLSISDRVIGMINIAFPSNPNAVMTKIRLAGWDERRVEAALMKTDTTKGVNYFASICRGMSDDDIEKVLKPEVRDQTSQQPERIMTKDGKKVLVNGEWLTAATPYENMPTPKAQRTDLTRAYEKFFFRIESAFQDKRISKEDYDKLGWKGVLYETNERAGAGEISLDEFIRLNVEEQSKYGITKENSR